MHKLLNNINNLLWKVTGFTLIKPSPRHSTRFCKSYFNGRSISVVEIGTYKGVNAQSILKNLNVRIFFLVDPYEYYIDSANSPTGHEVKKVFLDNINRIARNKLKKYSQVRWVKKSSDDAINFVPKKIDFVYIDGNHSYEYVLKDLENYYEKISPGGVLAGHDISMPEVISALQDFSRKKKVYFQVAGQDWWLIKPPY